MLRDAQGWKQPEPTRTTYARQRGGFYIKNQFLAISSRPNGSQWSQVACDIFHVPMPPLVGNGACHLLALREDSEGGTQAASRDAVGALILRVGGSRSCRDDPCDLLGQTERLGSLLLYVSTWNE
jgi:hypothetical protein